MRNNRNAPLSDDAAATRELLQRVLTSSPAVRTFAGNGSGRVCEANRRAMAALERAVDLIESSERRLQAGQPTAARVLANLAAVEGAFAETIRISRSLYTTNTLALQLIQRAKLYADHAVSQRVDVLEMLEIADAKDGENTVPLLSQALWTAELAFNMVTAGVAMLNAAALEIAVDAKKSEALPPRQ
jgi:hypothetical protein